MLKLFTKNFLKLLWDTASSCYVALGHSYATFTPLKELGNTSTSVEFETESIEQ